MVAGTAVSFTILVACGSSVVTCLLICLCKAVLSSKGHRPHPHPPAAVNNLYLFGNDAYENPKIMPLSGVDERNNSIYDVVATGDYAVSDAYVLMHTAETGAANANHTDELVKSNNTCTPDGDVYEELAESVL